MSAFALVGTWSWTTPVELAGGLTLMLAGSRGLAVGVEQLGEQLRLGGGYLGLLTALGANSPEITAGITGLVSGSHDAGYGVVLGSNVFNLAALLGLGALVAGSVELGTPALALHGAVAVAITIVAVALIHGWIPPAAAAVATATVFAPYVVLLGLPVAALRRLPAAAFLTAAAGEEGRAGEEYEPGDAGRTRSPGWRRVAGVVAPSLAGVVLGGAALTHAALHLAGRLGISDFLVGGLVLASVTGVPNLSTALRLARAGRGRAVVSETLNSNTLNLIVGVMVPALAFGTSRTGGKVALTAWWLLGATGIALALTGRGGGLGRRGGLLVVAVYLAFVVVAVTVAV